MDLGFKLLIVVFDLSTQLVALMSWVEGPFGAYLTLAMKSDFTTPQLDFLRQNRWPWHPQGQYKANNWPMAASSGIQRSPRPAVLGDVLGTVPAVPHGNPHGSRSRCIFSVDNLMSWITVAKQPWYGQLNNISKLYYYSLLCINVVRILWWPADSNECHFGYH